MTHAATYDQEYITSTTVLNIIDSHSNRHGRRPERIYISDFWLDPVVEWVLGMLERMGITRVSDWELVEQFRKGNASLYDARIVLVPGDLPMWCESEPWNGAPSDI